MFSLRTLLAVSLLPIVSILACQILPAWADDDEDEAVQELMEKTHEGKNSPWKKSQKAVAAEPVDWAALTASLPRFEAMAKALAESKNQDVRLAADGYIGAVKSLLAETKKKDAVRTRAAIKALAESCGDCHYKGGPGGKLD